MNPRPRHARRLSLATLLLIAGAGSSLAQEPADSADEPGLGREDDLAAQLAEQRAELERQRQEIALLKASSEEAAALAKTEDSEAETTVDMLEEGRKLSVYGFIDAGWQKIFLPRTSFIYNLAESTSNTMVLGNINLFFDAQPGDEWRALTEIRLTNAPHGADLSLATPLGGDYERVDNRVFESGSVNGRSEILVGGIVIERAWIEWAYRDWLQLKVGLWFTPWGIWNVDHGTPTLISMILPDFQVSEYFPRNQIGVQAHGRRLIDRWELGYHAYVSNGRVPGQLDVTEDKAIGGRLYASHLSRSLRMTLGLSGFHGTFVDYTRAITRFEPFAVETQLTVEAQEWAVGADVAIDRGPVRVRSEAAVRRVDYAPGKREPGFGPGAFAPDAYELNAYVLGSYRLPWAGLEPYLYSEVVHGARGFGDTTLVQSAGLNVHLSAAAQLKLQYAHASFMSLLTDYEQPPSDNNLHVVVARLALAF